jgi:hypothetical protein
MKLELVTPEDFRAAFQYNPETGDLYRKLKIGGIRKINFKKYRSSRSRVRLNYTLYEVTHIIWMIVHGKFPDNEIDHINRNCEDNRLSNLREATHQQNNRNRGLSQNSSSGITGVSWSKAHNRWRAHITVNHRFIHLGLFSSADEAVSARKKAETLYFKEFRSTV